MYLYQGNGSTECYTCRKPGRLCHSDASCSDF
ncbi:hypothetical protein [Parabacteroides johnsonii]